MGYASEAADVFNAKAEIQKIVDTSSTTVKGCKLDVRVEVGAERKKWLTTYFNHVRALETATGLSSEKGQGQVHLELRDMSVQHVDWPSCAIGKLSKERNCFEFDVDMLSKLKLTESEVRKHLKAINGDAQTIDKRGSGGPGMDTVSRPQTHSHHLFQLGPSSTGPPSPNLRVFPPSR